MLDPGLQKKTAQLRPSPQVIHSPARPELSDVKKLTNIGLWDLIDGVKKINDIVSAESQGADLDQVGVAGKWAWGRRKLPGPSWAEGPGWG